MNNSLNRSISVLFVCTFTYIFSEVLLAPFYPVFFEKVFGVEDLTYTGFYIFICRMTVVVTAPFWGFFSNKLNIKTLLYCGQICSALVCVFMTFTQNVTQFTIATVILLLFRSSFVILYPLIIQLGGEQRRETIAGTYQAVFHSGIVISSIAGIWIIQLENPLNAFFVVALLDILQFALCWFFLEDLPKKEVIANDSKSETKTTDILQSNWALIPAIGVIGLLFQFIHNLVRPYFVSYVTEADYFGTTLTTGGILFAIPSVMAIAALPFIRSYAKPHRIPMLYTIGSLLLAVTLLVQGSTNSLSLFVFSRVIYGFFLAVTQAALELYLFNNSDPEKIPLNYTLMFAFANVGLVLSPLTASHLVEEYSFASPLIVAAVLSVFTLAYTWSLALNPVLAKTVTRYQRSA
ncbi:major facilitator superfamily MFS_1 [[Leptolyngbya] sp. PCC 7376]|uniref:MFS transporter n=1 Tax=[Leptolyngbya] sp. PCC 7376 TaxID=111781 RepID=UPI00029F4559|nr:MFS transporter [[Leptolyngbya] sp. PCC 7376]AFY40277.1 major facilitator superfamily MFS_1 [[Leptolyngbya] sp. PCC 7376]